MGRGQRWQVAVADGIRVNEKKDISSPVLAEQLPHGAIVEELELDAGRLRFSLLTENGPRTGWVTTEADGRSSLVRRLGTPEARFQRTSAEERARRKQLRAADDGAPLGGWATLGELHGKGLAETPVVGVAETGGGSGGRYINPEDLPPIDELEDASIETLMDYLGFPERAAHEFVRLDAERKKKIIAESKALISMSEDQRRDALASLRKAWPGGPMPSFAPDAGGPELLPKNSCFPLSRHLQEGSSGVLDASSWGLGSSAAKVDHGFFARKSVASPEAQGEFFQSLKCDVTCNVAEVEPESSIAQPDFCRLDGQLDVEQIIATVIGKGVVRPEDVAKYFNRELKTRPCFLDGGLVERLKAEDLSEADYRGDRFKTSKEMDAAGKPISFLGNMDMLSLTKPNLIFDIHKEYFAEGSDICRTNTFCSNSSAQTRYKMQKIVYELNKSSATIAKKAAAEVTKADRKPRFVAGVLGPVSAAPWDELVEVYDESLRGLVDGGVDILMLDGVADTLAVKAAIFAVDCYFSKTRKRPPPLMVNADIEPSGHTEAGASLQAVSVTVKHAKPFAVGASAPVECFRSLCEVTASWCILCQGSVGRSPEKFAADLADYGKSNEFNFLGGDSTVVPAHIGALVRQSKSYPCRALPSLAALRYLKLSGLDACLARPNEGFQVVGQRCTSMGCAKFKKLLNRFKATLSENSLASLVAVCKSQSEKGAAILDINLDSDSSQDHSPADPPTKGLMTRFITACAKEPKIAKLPFMICSSDLNVVREGLLCAPGKCIVNGICLMLGEEAFLRAAKECQTLGAAVVVLAIGEKGPVETKEQKVRICQRSYKLLRTKLDFPPEDIVFDCQLSPLGPDAASQATTFMSSIAELKRTCPFVSFICGVGNLSLPFRGLSALRDAMHAVFLYHAVPQGLNLAMLEPAAMPLYSAIDSQTRVLCEEVILNQSTDGSHFERFMAFANFRSDSLLCLPMNSHLQVPATARVFSFKETAPQGTTTRGLNPSVAQQRQYWKSIRCSLSCTANPIAPESGVEVNLCRLQGPVDASQIINTIKAKGSVPPEHVAKYLNAQFKQRVCVLDGDAMAHMKSKGLSLADTLTKPDDVLGVYADFLRAGADICCTATLAANAATSPAAATYEINKAAAQLAKRAASEVTMQDNKPRFVAGAIGPAPEGTAWGSLVQAFLEQVRGLIDGGVDLLAIKMVTDTLQAKAAIYAIDEYFKQGKEKPPLLITTRFSGATGRTMSGQSLEAFFISIRHAKPFSVGVHSESGNDRVIEAMRNLAKHCSTWCHVTVPEAAELSELLAKDSCVNIVGGGRDSLPSVASSIASAVKGTFGRSLPALPTSPRLHLSGLDAYTAPQDFTLSAVGQRCNVMGSAAWRVLVDAYKATNDSNPWEAALNFCARQIDSNAEILDFNFDSDVADGSAIMGKFLRLCSTRPKVANVPFIISSYKWSAIEKGLQHVQGKCIVNAISLASGEHEFLELAKACRRYGAAVIVVAMDGQGEAALYSDKVRICQRGYELLRKRLDYPAEDIIFDCGLCPIGVEESNSSPKDFIDAVAELKRSCPHASFIGGIGNLSLSFRDTCVLREALHSVFLYHAIPKGLNMAIMDCGRLPIYTDLDPRIVSVCEEAILGESTDGGHLERIFEFARSSGVAVDDAPALLTSAPDQEGILQQFAPPDMVRGRPSFKQPMTNLVQATGTINASIFQTFGSKCHAARTFHNLQMCTANKRCIHFSSISVWMGQGGSGPITGASSLMDGLAMLHRQQGLMNMSCTVLWGAIGEIGLRLAIYGSRDVFAQFDLGQKLIGPADTQFLEKQIMTCNEVFEFIGMAYLDQTWQNTLAGTGGGGLEGRKTFADM